MYQKKYNFEYYNSNEYKLSVLKVDNEIDVLIYKLNTTLSVTDRSFKRVYNQIGYLLYNKGLLKTIENCNLVNNLAFCKEETKNKIEFLVTSSENKHYEVSGLSYEHCTLLDVSTELVTKEMDEYINIAVNEDSMSNNIPLLDRRIEIL